MANKKAEKELRKVDFNTALATHPAASLFEGSTVGDRTAATADVSVEIGVVRSEDVPFDQETLLFKALTPKGVSLLCAEEDFHAKDETADQMMTGLFNYALGLRIRGNVSRTMKTASQGPEKALGAAKKQLSSIAASGALDKLPKEQADAIRALLGLPAADAS